MTKMPAAVCFLRMAPIGDYPPFEKMGDMVIDDVQEMLAEMPNACVIDDEHDVIDQETIEIARVVEIAVCGYTQTDFGNGMVHVSFNFFGNSVAFEATDGTIWIHHTNQDSLFG